MMPPIGGCHPKMLESSVLFCRLAGLVAPAKIFVVMAVLGGRPTSAKGQTYSLTPFEKAER